MPKGKKENLVGFKFNGLEVIEEFRGEDKRYMAVIKCHCGKTKTLSKKHVKEAKISSCGCVPRKNYEGKHGDYKTKIYKNYFGIVDRCGNPNNQQYHNYGGRGIKLCEEWSGEEGYLNFKEWALNNGYEDGQHISLDRIDVNGDYSPDNCRYADGKTQGRNKQDNWYEYYEGKKRLVIELCEELGLKYNTVATRKHRGYSGDLLFVKRIKKSQFI